MKTVDRRCAWWGWGVSALLVPTLLGCMLIPNGPDPEPPVEMEQCSDDHAQFWEPDSRGASVEFAGVAADADCNEAEYFSGGGGQGGDVYHFEPQLRVTSDTLELPDFPAVEWQLFDPETGEQLLGSYIEVYDEDIVTEEGGFLVTPRAFIGPNERGKNFIVEMAMELVDTTVEVNDSSESNIVKVSARAGAHLVQ